MNKEDFPLSVFETIIALGIIALIIFCFYQML